MTEMRLGVDKVPLHIHDTGFFGLASTGHQGFLLANKDQRIKLATTSIEERVNTSR